MNECQNKILAEGSKFNVSYCECCRRIGLFYNNILSGFEWDEFKMFAESIIQLDFNSNSILFPNGENQIIIVTCHPDIQFTFNYLEFYHFKQVLEESLIMLEVHEALSA